MAPPGMTKKTDSPLKMQIDMLREKQQKQEETLKRRKEQQMAEMAGDTGGVGDTGDAGGREVTVEHPLLGTSCNILTKYREKRVTARVGVGGGL